MGLRHASAHGGELVEAGERAEAIGAERIEAHRDAFETGGFECCGVVGEKDAVGGEREIDQARLVSNHANERR